MKLRFLLLIFFFCLCSTRVLAAADIVYWTKNDVQVGNLKNEKYAVTLYQVHKDAIQDGDAEEAVKEQAKRYPDGFIFAQKSANPQIYSWWMAIYARLQDEPLCALFPADSKTLAHKVLLEKSGVETDFPLLSISQDWGKHEAKVQLLKQIKEKGLSLEENARIWPDDRGTNFPNGRDELAEKFFNECAITDWDLLAKAIRDTSEDNIKVAASRDSTIEAEKEVEGKEGKEQPTTGASLTEIERKSQTITQEKAKLQGEIDALRGEIEQKNADIAVKDTQLDKDKESIDRLQIENKRLHQLVRPTPPGTSDTSMSLWWPLSFIGVVLLLVLISFPYHWWLLAEKLKSLRGDVYGDTEKYTRQHMKELKTWFRDQFRNQRLGFSEGSTTPRYVVDLFTKAQECARELASNNARFQSAMNLLEPSANFSNGTGDGQLNQAIDWNPRAENETRSFMQLLGNLSQTYQQTKSSEIDQPKPADMDRQISASLDMIQPLSQMLLDLDDSYRSYTDRMRGEKLRLNEKMDGLRYNLDSINEQLQSSKETVKRLRKREDQYHEFLYQDLIAAGYLDYRTNSGSTELKRLLPEAINLASNNEPRRKIVETYVRSYTNLRSYLEQDEVRALPYFPAAGLPELLATLEEKTEFRNLYGKIEGNIIGQWKGSLHLLWRSILLLETYWPDLDHSELVAILHQTRNNAAILLHLAGIKPHDIHLPEDSAWLERNNNWAEVSETVDPRSELLASNVLKAKTKSLLEQGTVYFDVSFWGFDHIPDTEAGSETFGAKSKLVPLYPK